MTQIKSVTLLFLFLFPIGKLTAQEEAQFPETTIEKFEQSHSKFSNSTQQIDTVPEGLSIRAQFTGKIKKLSKDKRKFLKTLTKSEPINANVFDLYQREIEVKESHQTYWIPIQSQLLSVMKEELQTDEPIILFLRFVGTTKKGYVFLLIHFSHVEKHSYEGLIQ